jgi:hypothetical protein
MIRNSFNGLSGLSRSVAVHEQLVRENKDPYPGTGRRRWSTSVIWSEANWRATKLWRAAKVVRKLIVSSRSRTQISIRPVSVKR